MTVIQEGGRRWYRSTYVTKSCVKPNAYYLYGIGLSGNPVLIGTYTTRRVANCNRMMHHIHYIRAKSAYVSEVK